jgi:hypothetical protein
MRSTLSKKSLTVVAVCALALLCGSFWLWVSTDVRVETSAMQSEESKLDAESVESVLLDQPVSKTEVAHQAQESEELLTNDNNMVAQYIDLIKRFKDHLMTPDQWPKAELIDLVQNDPEFLKALIQELSRDGDLSLQASIWHTMQGQVTMNESMEKVFLDELSMVPGNDRKEVIYSLLIATGGVGLALQNVIIEDVLVSEPSEAVNLGLINLLPQSAVEYSYQDKYTIKHILKEKASLPSSDGKTQYYALATFAGWMESDADLNEVTPYLNSSKDLGIHSAVIQGASRVDSQLSRSTLLEYMADEGQPCRTRVQALQSIERIELNQYSQTQLLAKAKSTDCLSRYSGTQ